MDIDEFSDQDKIQDTEMHEEEDTEIHKEEYPQDINDFEPNCTLSEALNCIDKLNQYGSSVAINFLLIILKT